VADNKKTPGEEIGAALFKLAKPVYKEAKRMERERNRYKRPSSYYERPPRWSQKEIVFSVLPQAMRNAGSSFSARDLYYAVRPLYQHHIGYEWKELKYSYFSQTLLTQYQEEHGEISGLWRDPRGNFHEPHSGKSISLGTREVAAYEFPKYQFDKILYVEKEGEIPKLKAARLAEKYDMAIVGGKGYPTEAVRDLFSHAEGGDYQLFVFHDADIDGYNIARVLGEETRRMPYHNVNVVDIGLTVEDALEMGLPGERFNRKADMPWEIAMRLNETEETHFRHLKQRFEINAILPDMRRIEYIERKLQENGIRSKLIPPDDALKDLREKMYRDKVEAWTEEIIAQMLKIDELKQKVGNAFMERFGLDGAREWIEKGFEEDCFMSWREVLDTTLEKLYEDDHAQVVSDAVREHVRKSV
jgi:Topoisomerase 6 subunit A/Spo11, Toprim domain